MRFILGVVTTLILGAAALVLGWQQSEIRHLRTQMAEQSADQAPKPARRSASAGNVLGLNADERRFVLSQYEDVLARMNLPPTKAARLQDLLSKRIEVVLEAQEDASREGFAEGSPEMARAESSAIAGVDQEIAGLLGAADDRRLVSLTTETFPEAPAALPAPAAPPVVVNVINQAPAPSYPAPAYADAGDASYAADASAAPYPYYASAYYYYPYATVITGRAFGRPFFGARPFNNARSFEGQRFEPVRSERSGFAGAGERGTRRTR